MNKEKQQQPPEQDNNDSVGPFTFEEFELVEDIMEVLSNTINPQNVIHISYITEKFNRIRRFHSLALDKSDNHPEFKCEIYDDHDLIENLININPHDFELRLPTRTIFGKTLIDLEISFWGFIIYSLEILADENNEKIIEHYNKKVSHHLSKRVYNRMTAELLTSVATNTNIKDTTRQQAIRYLITLWKKTAIEAMRNFAPLMESIWAARKKAKIVMGTMMGIQEMFDMQINGATPHFLNFIASHGENEEIQAAFREFLFGATYEELCRKDSIRKENGVIDSNSVISSFDNNKVNNSTLENALGIYRFFTKRKLEAKARQMSNSPGPKSTAEEFLLIYFLEKGL
ncbi:MAG: hypothetical protein ACQES9_04185 [Myxococcota bacterium]